jgi:hypothetical protein
VVRSLALLHATSALVAARAASSTSLDVRPIGGNGPSRFSNMQTKPTIEPTRPPQPARIVLTKLLRIIRGDKYMANAGWSAESCAIDISHAWPLLPGTDGPPGRHVLALRHAVGVRRRRADSAAVDCRRRAQR